MLRRLHMHTPAALQKTAPDEMSGAVFYFWHIRRNSLSVKELLAVKEKTAEIQLYMQADVRAAKAFQAEIRNFSLIFPFI